MEAGPDGEAGDGGAAERRGDGDADAGAEGALHPQQAHAAKVRHAHRQVPGPQRRLGGEAAEVGESEIVKSMRHIHAITR